MFNILAAVGGALINKAFGGGGQKEEQDPIFTFKRHPQLPYTPLPNDFPRFGGGNALANSPIAQAYQAGSEQPKSKKSGGFNFKDEFLSSLTGNLVQRMLFGGPQTQYNYAPPSFR